MATINRFEDLEIWQLARALNKETYKIVLLLEQNKNFKLKEQLDAAAGSVMDNIAEGFDRQGTKEFIHFLSISKASLSELRSQLYRVMDREIITEDVNTKLQVEAEILNEKIGRFMTYLNHTSHRGSKFNTPTK